MALFTDTVTVYNKIADTQWKRTVVKGVQWTDKTDRKNENGRISVVSYISLTFPRGTYESLDLNPSGGENGIVYGEVTEEVTGEKGNRLSDLLSKYPKSGRILSVNDNTNRAQLKHKKVVLG